MSERQSNFFDVCCQCGRCCKDARPPISLNRRKIVEKHLKEHAVAIESPFVQSTYVFPREDTEGYCIFFDKETKRCQIHPVKPETCVAGPITFDINPRTGRIEWYLKMEKICPLAGRLYKNQVMFQKHLRSAKAEILRLISALDSNALKAILKIAEPETRKIDEDPIGQEILSKIIDS